MANSILPNKPLAGASEYNFYQLVRRLESLLDEGQIRFSAQNSQAFKAEFVDSLTLTPGHSALLKVNGFGLLGQQGPLPQVYSDLLYQESKEGNNGAFEFINLFQNRLLHLLYLVKKRFDPMLFNSQASNSGLFDLLLALSGLNTTPIGERLPVALEKLAGFGLLLVNKRSDYSAIKTTLAALFDCEVDIEPLLGDWRTLPERFRAALSKGSNRLGSDIGLGRRYWDNNAAIGVTLHLADKNSCHEFLPGGLRHNALSALLSFLVDGKYKVRVTLKVKWPAITPAQLTRPALASRLGQTAWLKSDPHSQAHPHMDAEFVVEPSLYRKFWQEAV